MSFVWCGTLERDEPVGRAGGIRTTDRISTTLRPSRENAHFPRSFMTIFREPSKSALRTEVSSGRTSKHSQVCYWELTAYKIFPVGQFQLRSQGALWSKFSVSSHSPSAQGISPAQTRALPHPTPPHPTTKRHMWLQGEVNAEKYWLHHIKKGHKKGQN